MIKFPLSPRQSLNKAYLKVRPSRSEIEKFKQNLIILLDGLDESESEEHNKNDLGDFLKNTFYPPKFYINTKDRTDLVIHNGPDSKSLPGILIEAKKQSKIYLYSDPDLTTHYRRMGYMIIGGDGPIRKCSEINFPPFGYLLCDDSPPPNDKMLNITSFKKFYIDKEFLLFIKTNKLIVDSFIPGVYK